MADFLFYVFLLALLAFVAMFGVWIVRSYMSGTSPVAALFGPRPERRLAVIEQASVDSRRRLLLVRRDDVEHLIMTGGPVDVVIETGIREPKLAVAAPEPTEPMFARSQRNFVPSATERAAE
jgi:flagellar protein FliO/FliZ